MNIFERILRFQIKVLCVQRGKLAGEPVFLIGLNNRSSIANDLLESGQIFHVALPSGSRNANRGLRAATVLFFTDVDHLVLFQNLQMPRQVSVGKSTKLFELNEAEAVRMCHQRRKNTQPRALVNNAIKAFVCKWCRGTRALLLHRSRLSSRKG